jgi:hypothetical protein
MKTNPGSSKLNPGILVFAPFPFLAASFAALQPLQPA